MTVFLITVFEILHFFKALKTCLRIAVGKPLERSHLLFIKLSNIVDA